MPLSFLNPALLAGLAAAAIPLIIHFLSRRRTQRVVFSDLRFLREEEAHQAQRRGVQRWLLLLVRMLIIACLVMAAARPHWGGLPGGGGRSVLFVVDASASMQAQGADGRPRFAEAVGLVGEMMQTLPGGSSVQVVLAAGAPQPVFATWLPAGPAARSALTAATVTDGPGDLAAVLRDAVNQVEAAPSRPVEVVLISDLQAVPHAELDAAAAELAAVGARVLVRRLGDQIPGGGVLDVALPGRALRPGEAAEVRAVVRPERDQQPFWLELDGRRVAETLAPAPGEAGGTVTVTFPLTAPGPGLHTGRVGKDPDRLPVDDVRPFVLSVPQRLEVLLAHGADRDGLGRGGWRYLARALDPAADHQGMFQVRTLLADSLRDGDLAGVDLLVLVDAGAPGRRLGTALRTWLTAGGALLVVAGDPGQQEDLREGILPILNLPREATWVARTDDQGERARVVAADHPVTAGLGDAAVASLEASRWWRYFAVDEGDARVILASASGAPLLLEGRQGTGRWALFTSHLRRDATDIMVNPVFLPLLQRLAARLAGDAGSATTVAVGETPTLQLASGSLARRPGDAATQLSVRVPPDGTMRSAGLTWLGTGAVLTASTAQRAGHYVFELAGDTLGAVAAAVPATESEPRVLETDTFTDRLRTAGLDRVLDLGEAGAAGLGRALAGRDLARWFLGAAFLLLGFELWLGRRVRA